MFVPTQTPVPQLNELFADKFVRNNPKLPPDVREAFISFQSLLPDTQFPQVSPVYNRLKDAQNEVTERILYGAETGPTLSHTTRAVQAEIDRLELPRGTALPSFPWLIAPYAGLVLLGVGYYFWQSRRFQATSRWRTQERWIGPLFASPWLVGAVVFTGGPLLYSLLLSFCSYDVQHEPRWIGIENFREILFEDSVAHRAALNTLFMMLSVPACLAVSLSLAVLLNNPIRFRGLWQSLFYMPVIVPMVASALAWIWLLNAQGPINHLLGGIGISGPNWLHDPAWSKPALLIMCAWTCGGSMIVWLAGLKAVPPTLYEAAALDGANALAAVHARYTSSSPALSLVQPPGRADHRVSILRRVLRHDRGRTRWFDAIRQLPSPQSCVSLRPDGLCVRTRVDHVPGSGRTDGHAIPRGGQMAEGN